MEPELSQVYAEKVCDVCKEKNLSEAVHLIHCAECSDLTCIHMCSAVDPAKCHECLKDVQVTEQTISKTTEHYNEETDKVYVKKQTARQIKLSGLDWLFNQRKIKDMSDEEVLLSSEYHQAMYRALMYEREERRMQHFHRNMGKPIPVNTSTGTISTTETVVKKTKTIKPDQKTKAMANVQAMVDFLLSQGKTIEDIMKMVGGKK